jgi:hypothetical protein
MRESENRILSIEWHIFLRRRNSRHAPRQIEGKLAHRLGSIDVKHDIEESIGACAIVGQNCFR